MEDGVLVGLLRVLECVDLEVVEALGGLIGQNWFWVLSVEK